VSQGHSQQVGLLMMNRAFSRFAHVIGYTCISGALLDVVGYQSARPSAVLWPALIPLALALVALAFLDRRRTATASAMFLLVGGAGLYLVALALFTGVPSVGGTDATALTLVKVALILVVGSGFRPRRALGWGVIGFVIGETATAIAALQTGRVVRVDVVSVAVILGLVLVEVTVALTRTRRMRVNPELERAVVDEELASLRYRIEVRAAALLHDVVLGHLTAIATAQDQFLLGPALKREIERDLEILIGEEWLADPSPEVDSQSRSDWRQSALFAAVQEARELSLTVDVTGDLSAVGRLDSERDIAVGLAVKQCLVNVLRHAQVDRAEVVILGSENDVSFMVVDAGRGFSERLVEADRLGIRQSVRRRIESVGGGVQLWSTPGRGTSVMIRVPATDRKAPSV
jgi:signal transduction histidine kinase